MAFLYLTACKLNVYLKPSVLCSAFGTEIVAEAEAGISTHLNQCLPIQSPGTCRQSYLLPPS